MFKVIKDDYDERKGEFNREMEIIKKNEMEVEILEQKNTMSISKYSQDRLNSRSDGKRKGQ